MYMYKFLSKKEVFEDYYVKQLIMKLRNNKVYQAPTVKVKVEDPLPRVEFDAPTYECDICDKVVLDCRDIIVDCENDMDYCRHCYYKLLLPIARKREGGEGVVTA